MKISMFNIIHIFEMDLNTNETYCSKFLQANMKNGFKT